MKVKIKKLHPYANLPTYATDGAGAFDIYSHPETDMQIPTFGQPSVIRTGVSIEVPENHVLLLFSRSGHGFKNSTRLANCVGVIDSDYRGEIMVKLTRDLDGGQSMNVGAFDRICQGIILPIPRVEFEEVEELSSTDRGEGGFGSTGAK